MFEHLRQSLKDLASGAIPPAQRSAAMAHMRATLVQARVGLADIAAAIETTRSRLAAEQGELDTVRRRKALAAQIGDNETVDIASRFEEKHAGRVDVLARKLAVQEDELRLAEAEVAGMMSELKSVAAGVGSGLNPDTPERAADDVLNEAENLRRDIDGLARQRAREARESAADDRLAELKRKMQK
jgi:hypothetical protein